MGLCRRRQAFNLSSVGNPRTKATSTDDHTDYVRITAMVPKSFQLEVRIEAMKRGITVGELVMEAFASRVRVIRHPESK